MVGEGPKRSIRGKAALKEVNIQFDVPIRVFPHCSQKLFFFCGGFQSGVEKGCDEVFKSSYPATGVYQ